VAVVSVLVTASIGAGIGVGVVILLAGVTDRALFEGSGLPRPASGNHTLVRAATAALAGIVVLAATRWFAAGLLVAAAVWAVPRLLGGRAARDAAIARTEAIAAWTEMVRDSIVAASGLEEAIAATGSVAPAAIAPEVRSLVRRLDHLSLPEALVAFGLEVRHPSADLVVASLVIAARMEASDLSSLLSRLADAIRDDARMRVRVEVGRTRVRTAAKVIVGVVAATVVLLAVTNRDYLTAYDEPFGQVVLAVAGGFFAVGGWLLDRMATVQLPERFNARTAAMTEATPW
jgi:Flp pilus assembly protein TadB